MSGSALDRGAGEAPAPYEGREAPYPSLVVMLSTLEDRLNARLNDALSRLHTRLQAVEADVGALRTSMALWDVALGPAHAARLELAKRPRLSSAEEVLCIPYLSQRSIMSFLRQDEALPLRLASRACRDAVAEHAWEDLCTVPPYHDAAVRGSLSAWRRCFPLARSANVRRNLSICDADFVHLEGLRSFAMSYCHQRTITDAAFQHLKGVKTFYMGVCTQTTITDAAYVHLRGIHVRSTEKGVLLQRMPSCALSFRTSVGRPLLCTRPSSTHTQSLPLRRRWG